MKVWQKLKRICFKKKPVGMKPLSTVKKTAQ